MNSALKRTALCSFLISLAFPLAALSQDKAVSCADLKNGVFHSYPQNTKDYLVNIREGEVQKETNQKNGDSTLWKVAWINDCTYSLKYISGNTKMPPEVSDMLKKKKLVFAITSVTDDYYVYKGYLDKVGGAPLNTDTLWLKEKVVIPNNTLFEPVRNLSQIRRQRFSDTSQYALLYVYRPGKFTNSRGNYVVYFNGNPMWVAKNNSGHVFKILKEGTFLVQSRLYKDESAVRLDVKFGQTYYVKSMIHWGITKRLYNFKLDMEAMLPKEGKLEFQQVVFQ